MDIKDRVVIVTGASAGIGLATTRALAAAGAKVVLAARSNDVLSANAAPGVVVDTPEYVAGKILEAIQKGPAEQFMDS